MALPVLFVKRWVGLMLPLPDYQSAKFKYLHIKDTPRDIDGAKREVNDFNPRVQLKKLFQQGQFKDDDSEKLPDFCQKFIVDEQIVKNALDDLHYKESTKETRKRERRNKRDAEQRQTYDDINWLEIVNSQAINTLLVSRLDKYLIRHNMNGCLKLKKKEKIQAISNHVNLQAFQNANNSTVYTENAETFENSSDNNDSDDEMDEVL